MAEEIIVCVSPLETRVAVVVQGLLQEVFVERLGARSLVGNVYKGKVSRVLPGMQSAFINIGEDRAAFAHISDLVSFSPGDSRGAEIGNLYPPIAGLLHEGQTVLVQITKEPISSKGPRVTTGLSFASRYLVFLPGGTGSTGISQRIVDEQERQRLLGLINDHVADLAQGGTFIIRTAAEGIHENDLLADMKYLQGKWSNISDDATASGVPALIYQDLPVQLRVLRDLVCEDTREITVNHQVTHQLLALFLSEFAPNKQDCLVLAEEGAPLFEIYNIEDQIKAALARQVPLKSGGYLVFDQTEAMTTIDVNTGSFTGKRDLEDTIYQTNIEAATVIPRQLRLRGIGGIVIVDFIDMLDEEHRRQVLRILEKGQHNDRVNWKISGFSEIGLVEMTRKRSKDSLLRITCEPCSVCQGRGYLKSAETVCLEIYREMQRKSADFKKGRYMILASPTVIDYLLENSSVYIEKLSEKVGDIQLQVEMSYSQEEYDIVMMESPESLQVSES